VKVATSGERGFSYRLIERKKNEGEKIMMSDMFKNQ
jgi:hypothetical protein